MTKDVGTYILSAEPCLERKMKEFFFGYNKALLLAIVAHHGQVRQGKSIPYVTHCVEVALAVFRHSGLKGNELDQAVVVALLHDTIEDTEVTFDEIQSLFDCEIASGVQALSKDKTIKNSGDESKLDQLLENLDRLVRAPFWVQVVKLADRFSNLKSPFPPTWSSRKIQNYLKESRLILEHLGPSAPRLAQLLKSRIVELESRPVSAGSDQAAYVL